MYRNRFESLENRLRVVEEMNKKEKRGFSLAYIVLVAIVSAGISWIASSFYANETIYDSQQKVMTPRSIVEGKQLKLNLGSGSRHMPGYLNVDKSDMFNPDVVWDLESIPWPFHNDSVQDIKMSHVLEHVGSDSEIFLKIIQELYRICENGAKIHVIVPHPYHSDFIADPTHVRPVSFDLLLKFSKRSNREWIANSKADTPFGLLLDVDFDFQNFHLVLDHHYVGIAIERGILTMNEANNMTFVYELSKVYGNLVKQISLDMIVRK